MFVVIPIIFILVFLIIGIVCYKLINKHSGLKNLIDSDGINSLKDTVSKMKDSILEATTTNCEYCGSKCEKSDDKCPNCGANINNSKK